MSLRVHEMDWPYLTYHDHNLFNEDGTPFSEMYFTNIGQAEAWLEENNVRGTIR